MAIIKIPNVQFRDGRPRWKPSDNLRKLGYYRENLQHPDGRWFTLDECLAWCAERDADIKLRKAERAGPKRRPKATPTLFLVEDVFETLWTQHAFLTPREQGGLSPKTIKGYKGFAAWLKAFDASLWGTPAASVQRKHAKKLHEAIQKKTSLSMANAVLRVCRLAWNHAIDAGHVSANPFLALRIRTSPKRVRVATPEEMAALMAAADNEKGPAYDPEIGDAIILGFETGQRQSDLLELVSDGLDNGRITFKQNKTGVVVSVKTTPELAQRLEEIKARKVEIAARLQKTLPANTILSRHTGTPIQVDAFRHRFAEVRAEAAKRVRSVKSLKFLDLRDTAVTRLARAGATVPQIAAISGHSLASATRVLEHYMALDSEMADAAIDKLNAYNRQRKSDGA
jgi:integrase